MTDTTKTTDKPPVDPPCSICGGTDHTMGQHEGNVGGTVSPMGQHEGNSAPTGTTT